MKTMTKGVVSIALLATAFVVGCGAGSGSNDAGVAGSTGTAGGGAAGSTGAGGDVCGGATLYGLSPGDSCFKITDVMSGSSDGCMLGVAEPVASNGLIGASLPVNQNTGTGVLTVGTMGSLGSGAIMCNQGTLTRDGNTTLKGTPACMWHQTDTSMVTITATNEFDISVTEAENMFMGCTADFVDCTSTWTWHMVKDTTKSPTSDPPCSQ
jgi:hypothetical protein